ncbi:histidine kinase [Kribbella sp. NPDC055071]
MVFTNRTAAIISSAALLAAVIAWAVGATSVLATMPPAQAEDFGTPYGDIVLSVAALSFALMGFFVVRWNPGNRVGWMLLAAGVCVQVFGAADGAGAAGVSDRAAVGFAALLLVAIPLIFPTGRPLSRPWRRFGWACALLTLVALVYPPAGRLIAPAGVGALISLAVRYRRGGEVERLQLRWLGVSSLYALGSLIAIAVVGRFLPRPTPMWFRVTVDAGNLLIAAVPVAIGIAVLKYRLWAIDAIADRTLVILGVGGFTSAIYVAVVVGVGSAIGSRGNIWLLVLATVVVALTLQPLRRLVEASSHRLVYGRRIDPYEILTDFSRQVAATRLGSEAMLSCAHAAAAATFASGAHTWILLGGAWQHIAGWPKDEPDTAFPGRADQASAVVEHDGAVLGAISVVKDGDLSPGEKALLRDLAAQAAMLFRNVALNADLHRRLVELSVQAEELRLSRRRILTAEDTARQRIERDLHDGAQQRLVTLGISLQRLRTKMSDDPRLLAQLDNASTDLRQALSELRELARGIHPALLVEAGLADAVTALVERSAVATVLLGVPSRRYPQPIETTAYYVVSEALTNVAKHAPAATAQVEIIDRDGHVVVRIADNGPGGADQRSGTGLRGLGDRVASVRGTLTVRTGDGTEIIAELPCD